MEGKDLPRRISNHSLPLAVPLTALHWRFLVVGGGCVFLHAHMSVEEKLHQHISMACRMLDFLQSNLHLPACWLYVHTR